MNRYQYFTSCFFIIIVLQVNTSLTYTCLSHGRNWRIDKLRNKLIRRQQWNKSEDNQYSLKFVRWVHYIENTFLMVGLQLLRLETDYSSSYHRELVLCSKMPNSLYSRHWSTHMITFNSVPTKTLTSHVLLNSFLTHQTHADRLHRDSRRNKFCILRLKNFATKIGFL